MARGGLRLSAKSHPLAGGERYPFFPFSRVLVRINRKPPRR
jgi:hypothetical protein